LLHFTARSVGRTSGVHLTPFGVTGDNVAVKGEQNVRFQIGEVTFKHTILVSRLHTMAAGILGMDFLTPRQAVLDLGGSTMTLCHGVNYAAVETLQVSSHENDWNRRETRIDTSCNCFHYIHIIKL
jgi:hypothetical protein